MIALLALLLAACYSPKLEYENGQLACPDDVCPTGMHCASDDTCWHTNESSVMVMGGILLEGDVRRTGD